jgi:cell division protein FtsB
MAARKKRFLVLFLLLFMILGLLTFFGEKGVFHLLGLKKELARIEEENLKMEEENKQLKEEVRKLQQEKRYIEEIARKELGMVKEGEVLYQFESPSRTQEKGR